MDVLVIVATGGRGTKELKARYPQPNVVVRDYVDFAAAFDFTDVFITNGGFGGVQISLSKGVPLVVSGINDGESDVNVRVEHAGVGINLRTESPKPAGIATSVGKVLADPRWKSRARKMQEQFDREDPAEAAASVVEAVGGRPPGWERRRGIVGKIWGAPFRRHTNGGSLRPKGTTSGLMTELPGLAEGQNLERNGLLCWPITAAWRAETFRPASDSCGPGPLGTYFQSSGSDLSGV